MSQCTAKSKRTGNQCQAPAMRGSTKCYHHGGKTPAGFALPQTTHGRYSKVLPTRLLERFGASLADPELLDLTHDIALLDSRLEDLLKRVDTGESGKLWQMARQALEDFRKAQSGGDKSKILEALFTLDQTISRGHSDYMAWDEVSDLLERRRRLVESERKRKVEMHQMLRLDEFMSVMQLLANSVRENVKDPDAIRAISRDFELILADRT